MNVIFFLFLFTNYRSASSITLRELRENVLNRQTIKLTLWGLLLPAHISQDNLTPVYRLLRKKEEKKKIGGSETRVKLLARVRNEDPKLNGWCRN